jgi:hypothetical protein
MKKHINPIVSSSIVWISHCHKFRTKTDKVFAYITGRKRIIHSFASLCDNISKTYSLLFKIVKYWIPFKFKPTYIWVLSLLKHSPSSLYFNRHWVAFSPVSELSNILLHWFCEFLSCIVYLEFFLCHH